MKTTYLTAEQLDRAGQMLAMNQLVAFPTETVYGLGANAFKADSVARIFEAKGRPSDNPLIVHIADLDQIYDLASHVPENARSFMDEFWPGPLTLVLPKNASVPKIVTAGMETVAIRMPAHPWAKAILEHAGKPIAAPSANRSGSPSATTWQAVKQDLDGRIEGIVCGPPCSVGLESTVLDVSRDRPRILRPGSITYEQICALSPEAIPFSELHRAGSDAELNSPGLRHQHYKPAAKVMVLEPSQLVEQDLIDSNFRMWYIGLRAPVQKELFELVQICETLEQYGYELFHFFRKADVSGVATIFCESVELHGFGTALMDRIRRASN